MEPPFETLLEAPPLALRLRWRPAPSPAGGAVLHGGPDVLLERVELLRAGEPMEPALRPSPPFPHAEAMLARLRRQAAGEDPDWRGLPPSIQLDFSGLTPFSRQVLDTLWDKVGHGRTVSYGELARLSGRPGAARAVGRVMASNRWPLLIPCHRVVGSKGELTGFTGSGVAMKQWLLEREGAVLA